MNNPERISVNDTVAVFLHNGSVIEAVVKKIPDWFSKIWIILDVRNKSLYYIKDYSHMKLIKKTRKS